MPLPPVRVLPVTPFDPYAHFHKHAFVPEYDELEECAIDIRNIGWTLGNDCPYHCNHCYSTSARHDGRWLNTALVDRIVDQLSVNGIETVNLGGNEPLFTNGVNVEHSLLPYIVRRLHGAGIEVGLTTAGVTLVGLLRHFPEVLELLNDVDVSLDSPFEQEHNTNRGAPIYHEALRALEICRQHGIERTVIMCAMDWNFDRPHLQELVGIASHFGANVRVNPIKTIEAQHLPLKLSAATYYEGFAYLMSACDCVDLGEPPLAAMSGIPDAKGCPCGRTSFRIHSIKPDGTIPVSPCVYLHDYKVGDLVTDDLADIVRRPEFQTFRRRNARPDQIPGCEGCDLLAACRGGCAARSYLTRAHESGEQALFTRDPYCPKLHPSAHSIPHVSELATEVNLVHKDYLCTWIGRPRSATTSPAEAV
jgi:radical SAM protein with 4Fe4S-binding SPASM domain